MRLSEAIRLGAMMKPQGFGWLQNDYLGSFSATLFGEHCTAVNRGVMRTCALGAALDAIGFGGKEEFEDGDEFNGAAAIFPILNVEVQHPHPKRDVVWSVKSIIVELNDTIRWTREEVADWVETIERQQEQPQAESIELALVTAG